MDVNSQPEPQVEAQITSATVKFKITGGIYKTLRNSTSKSAVWGTFEEILNENEEKLDFVFCRICEKVLTRNRRTYSNLLGHPCAKKLTNTESIEVPLATKKQISDACVDWTIRNCVPFSIVDGEGFQALLKEVLQVGALHGPSVDVKKMLPHRTTISNNVSTIFQKEFPLIKEEIAKIKFGGVTTDLWTDRYKKLSYLSLTIHYQQNDKLKERVLAVKHFNYDRQSGANILETINDIFEEYGLVEQNIVFVTDRGSNIISALANYTRISCAVHLLNNVLSSAVSRTEEFAELCAKAKALVQYFKKSSNLQRKLKTVLKSECVTRWNTKLYMFKSIKENWNEIVQILNEKNQLNRIDGMQLQQIEQIIPFLAEFEAASIVLQKSGSPTLHLCLPYYHEIISKCDFVDDDSELMRSLKDNCKEQLINTWKPHILDHHLAATFLFPLCKKLNVLSAAEKETVHKFVEEQYAKLAADTQVPAAPLSHEDDRIIPDEIQHRNMFTRFKDAYDLNNLHASVADEIILYLAEPVAHFAKEDLETYWHKRKEVFPKLFLVYSSLSCIPATSAASERSFSIANNVITAKRSTIGTENVNHILVLNSHYGHKENC